MIARLLLVMLVAAQAASKPSFFTTPYTLEQMTNKQAVIETTMGTIVMALLPAAAPNHVGHFMKVARDGAYNGTIFHRVIRYGIIQGGDPLSKDPAKTSQYGQGGLNELKAEFSLEKATAGAVAAVLAPGNRDSAGAQFFVCVTDQPALDGQYTVFGRVVDGIEVVQAISAMDADAAGMPRTRVVIMSVTIRDTPPPTIDPLVAASAVELGAYRATLETTKGAIELQMLADRAPETVRQFLRLASAGVYDGVLVHRVVPNFVIQTGALAYRGVPLTAAQNALVHNLPPEFSDTPNVPGVVSMARGDDPASASTSFFVCVGDCHSLDGKYTVFAKVSAGMDVVNAIAAVAVEGETPKAAVTVATIRVIR